MKEAVLQHFPENFQSVLKQHSIVSTEKDIMPAPNLDAYVFVRVLADCGQVAMDPSGCVSALIGAHVRMRGMSHLICAAAKERRCSELPRSTCCVCLANLLCCMACWFAWHCPVKVWALPRGAQRMHGDDYMSTRHEQGRDGGAQQGRAAGDALPQHP